MVSKKLAHESFERDGFVVLSVFSESEFEIVRAYTLDWVWRVIGVGVDISRKLELSSYHQWWAEENIEHGALMSAANRYLAPPAKIKDILINSSLCSFLGRYGDPSALWEDPGLDWLGFRFVRPGLGDGYPLSKKNWGAAAGVISVWAPIIGFGDQGESLGVVPESHLVDYPSYLPVDSKFTKNELRLQPSVEVQVVRPVLCPGDVLVYHPNLLHTEDVAESNITRLNLEYRFRPYNRES